jgi:peroxiredoxin
MTRLMTAGSSWSGRERNCCFLNLGDGTFTDVSAITGLDFVDDGRGAAISDWDGDGDLDVWLNNRTGPKLRFMRNDDPSKFHYVSIGLVGVKCNRDAIGARVEVYAGGRRYVRRLAAGDGYLSQSSKWLHFGLADADRIDRVVVHWPGGEAQTLGGFSVDARYTIKQGSSEPHKVAPRRVTIANAAPVTTEPAPTGRVVLRIPLPLPPSLTEDLFADSPAKPNRAKLINLWAAWCVPCLAELSDFAEHYKEIHEAGLDVLALSVDKPEEQKKAEKIFRMRVSGRATHPGMMEKSAMYGTVQTIQAIVKHVLDKTGEPGIPLSMLIDRNGSLQILYVGPVSAEQLIKDTALFGMKPDGRLQRSSFPGRWYYGTSRDLKGLAMDLFHRVRHADARFYAEVFRRQRAEESGAR